MYRVRHVEPLLKRVYVVGPTLVAVPRKPFEKLSQVVSPARLLVPVITAGGGIQGAAEYIDESGVGAAGSMYGTAASGRTG